MWQNAREILKGHKWQEIIYGTKTMQESALSLEMSITHGNLEAGSKYPHAHHTGKMSGA